MIIFDDGFRTRLLELFTWRRAVRRFRPDPLPPGTLERLIHIACLSPSVGLTQLRRFEHFSTPKWLRLLRPTPIGRHYSGIGGTGPAVILGGGWAGRSSFSFVSKRLRSVSGSV